MVFWLLVLLLLFLLLDPSNFGFRHLICIFLYVLWMLWQIGVSGWDFFLRGLSSK